MYTACLRSDGSVHVGYGVVIVYVDYDSAYSVPVSLCDVPYNGRVGNVVAASWATTAGKLAYAALVAGGGGSRC